MSRIDRAIPLGSALESRSPGAPGRRGGRGNCLDFTIQGLIPGLADDFPQQARMRLFDFEIEGDPRDRCRRIDHNVDEGGIPPRGDDLGKLVKDADGEGEEKG